jgi:hypothetical protein
MSTAEAMPIDKIKSTAQMQKIFEIFILDIMKI